MSWSKATRLLERMAVPVEHLYHFWFVLSGGVTVAAALVAYTASYPLVRAAFGFAGGLCAFLLLVMLPKILSHVVSSSTDGAQMNPALCIESLDYSYVVRRTGVVVDQIRAVRARRTIDRLTFHVKVLGTEPPACELLSPGELLGSVSSQDWDKYQVKFVRPLYKGDSYQLHTCVRTIDPERKMKPFLRRINADPVEGDIVHFRIHFPEDRPSGLVCEQAHVLSGEVKMEPIYLNQDGRGVWEAPAKLGTVCSISWQW